MKKLTRLALIVSAMGMLLGCKTTGDPPIDDVIGQIPQRRIVVDTVSFADPLPQRVGIPEENDPVGLVEFATRLAREGNHTEAATFFVEASELPSVGPGLKRACISAASVEYLKAGDLERFQKMVRDIRSDLNRYEEAVLDPGLAVLFDLQDLSQTKGQNSSSPRTQGVRNLMN